MKLVLSLLITFGLLATAIAGGNGPIRLTHDGTGDFLVGPAFFANEEGWNTQVRVMNTDKGRSVVAKISFADAAESGDLLDFVLYLSPGDVWEGFLIYDISDKNVYLQSSDDSMVIDGVPANIKPVRRELGIGLKASGAVYNDKFGYIEVIGMAQTDKVINGVDLGRAPVDKVAFYYAYDNNLNEAQLKAAGWETLGNDAISMEVVIYDTANKRAMTYNATAFENFMGDRVVPSSEIGVDIVFSDYSSKPEWQLISEVESAIKFTTFDFSYYGKADRTNETVLIMTAVTKRERMISHTIGTIWESDGNASVSSDYYSYFRWLSRDMQEHFVQPDTGDCDHDFSGGEPCPIVGNVEKCYAEVCYFTINDKLEYANGLFSGVLFGNNIAIPAIPLVMTVKEIGGAKVTNIAYPSVR